MRTTNRLEPGTFLLTAALVAAWGVASHFEFVPQTFVPTPAATWHALSDGLVDGQLGQLATATAVRMLLGWVLASAVGVGIGALVGSSATMRAWLVPTLELMRPLPASALVPIAIAVAGFSQATVLMVIAFGALWPVLLATAHGFASAEPRLYEVARVLQFSRWRVLVKIGIPNAMPDALAGMRLSLTVSLILAIVGEMLTAQSGLGTTILLAARSFRAADLFAGVVLLGLIGVASNAALTWVEAQLLKWKMT